MKTMEHFGIVWNEFQSSPESELQTNTVWLSSYSSASQQKYQSIKKERVN